MTRTTPTAAMSIRFTRVWRGPSMAWILSCMFLTLPCPTKESSPETTASTPAPTKVSPPRGAYIHSTRASRLTPSTRSTTNDSKMAAPTTVRAIVMITLCVREEARRRVPPTRPSPAPITSQIPTPKAVPRPKLKNSRSCGLQLIRGSRRSKLANSSAKTDNPPPPMRPPAMAPRSRSRRLGGFSRNSSCSGRRPSRTPNTRGTARTVT